MATVRVAFAAPHPVPDELVRLATGMLQKPRPGEPTRNPWGHGWSLVGELSDLVRGRAMVRRAAQKMGVDAALVPAPLAEEPPRLLMMDVDSTLTTSEAIDELAEAAGRKQEVAEITARAMHGELDFAASLTARVATLEGLPVSTFAEVVRSTCFQPGAVDLVRAARTAGCRVGLVSGGFVEIVRPLVADLGIDDITANVLEVRNNHLTGRLAGPIIDRQAKRHHLQRNAAQIGCQLSEVVAVGDGANDLDMLDCAGLGIAYCAKPVAAAQADATISFPRLDAIRGFVRI